MPSGNCRKGVGCGWTPVKVDLHFFPAIFCVTSWLWLFLYNKNSPAYAQSSHTYEWRGSESKDRTSGKWMFSCSRFHGEDLSSLTLPSVVMIYPDNFETPFLLPWTAKKVQKGCGFQSILQVFLMVRYTLVTSTPLSTISHTTICLKTSRSCPAWSHVHELPSKAGTPEDFHDT